MVVWSQAMRSIGFRRIGRDPEGRRGKTGDRWLEVGHLVTLPFVCS